MKTTLIPAQITTVEDKIAGNLSLVQLILLLSPFFISVFVFAVFPEKLHFNIYKVVLMLLVLVVFLFLAIRIKERIILTWLILLVSYRLRPHIFLFDKNDDYLREGSFSKSNEVKNSPADRPTQEKKRHKDGLSIQNLIQLENLINSRNTKIAIKFGRKRRLTLNRF